MRATTAPPTPKPEQIRSVNKLTIVKVKSEFCEGLSFNLEGLKRVGSVLILHGWIVDPGKQLTSIVLGKPGAAKGIDLKNRLVRFARPDVVAAYSRPGANIDSHYGFAAIVEDGPASAKIMQLAVALVATNGNAIIESLRVTHLDSHADNLASIVGIIPDTYLNAERCQKFYQPVFKAITSAAPPPVDACDERYGPPTPPPELSVIIPLYGETRFERIQIPAFAALRAAGWEIIFAVDDPKILEAVRADAKRLARLYALDIRVVAPTRNQGFSGINNFAATNARGRYLLFLNSDCFISQVAPIAKAMHWLNRESAGAVGFRMTYADRTIQHDGMSVSRWKGHPAFQLNAHPRRGLPINLIPQYPAQDDACLLTAACLMVTAERFAGVHGFDTDYVRGDFEDSDLCLKLVSAGWALGIVRDTGIFHLERQTIGQQEGGLRQKITLINSFIYTRKWQKTIEHGLPRLEVVA
ncbi:glycosyltransferase [Xylophilus sp. Kf1]|nr:glycosyltransferase [Xylophilus sp. Kf1]